MSKSIKLPYPYMVTMSEELSDAVERICHDNAIDRSDFILQALKLLVEYHNIPDLSIPNFNFDEQKMAQPGASSPDDDDDEQVLLAAEEE